MRPSWSSSALHAVGGDLPLLETASVYAVPESVSTSASLWRALRTRGDSGLGMGWLAIGGSLVMVGVGVTLFLFVRRKIREEERGGS